MDKTKEMNEKIIKAANMYILRKVMDTMLGCTEIYYKEIFNISRAAIDNICNISDTAAKTWDYVAVAEKMKMDPRVFSGRYLIELRGKCIEDMEKNFKEAIQANKILNQKERQEYINNKTNYIDEYILWKSVLDRDAANENIFSDKEMIKIKNFILRYVAEQTKDENFEDPQLWKFWNYIRQNFQ